MVEGKWFAPGKPFPEGEHIRRVVFNRGQDALDTESWNVLVWHEGEAAATGRIWWRDGAFWLGDIAVLPEKRGKGLGDLTLRLILFKAETHSARLIRTIAPVEETGFVTRLGFKPEGKANGGMQPLLLRGEELCLDTCKGCTKNCPNRQAE